MAVRTALNTLSKSLDAAVKKALAKASQDAVRSAKATTKFKDGDGTDTRNIKLRENIIWDFGPGPNAAFVLAGAKHASYIERGTTAHAIPLRLGGKTLHFKWNGVEFFRKSVVVSGIKPGRFMEEAQIIGYQSLGQNLRMLTDEAIAKFNSK